MRKPILLLFIGFLTVSFSPAWGQTPAVETSAIIVAAATPEIPAPPEIVPPGQPGQPPAPGSPYPSGSGRMGGMGGGMGGGMSGGMGGGMGGRMNMPGMGGAAYGMISSGTADSKTSRSRRMGGGGTGYGMGMMGGPTTEMKPDASPAGGMGMGMGGMYGGYGIMGAPVPEAEQLLKVFILKYSNTSKLIEILNYFFQNQLLIMNDERTKSLIVKASEQQLNQVEELIKILDIPEDKPVIPSELTNLAFRVFAVVVPPAKEISSSFKSSIFVRPLGEPMLEDFKRKIENSSFVYAFSPKIKDNKLYIESFSFEQQKVNNQVLFVLHISGKCFDEKKTDEKLRTIINSILSEISGYQVQDIKFGNNENSDLIFEGQDNIEIPDNVKSTVQKLLGKKITPISHWFGNISIPGECRTPLVNWFLSLQIMSMKENNEFQISVSVRDEKNQDFLRNTVNARLGQPIIIGFNRMMNGSPQYGALILIPQEEF